MNLVLLYIPVPDEETGRLLADKAVSNRWAACANLSGPVESTYEWDGKMCREQEWVLRLKTLEQKADEVSRFLEEIHPYDTPCILKMGVEANPAFAKWVHDCMG